MKKINNEQQMMHEFAEFIEADPVTPGEKMDKAILRLVEKDLRPARWKVYSKFTLVEVGAGLATLTVCPQFGLGFGQHNQFLHTLHASTPPVIYYLLCGLFFVIFGAGLSGLVLNREEVRTVGNNKYLYFVVYSFLAYFCLVTLGSQAFVASMLAWVLGALLGNILAFEAVVRLRHATAR